MKRVLLTVAALLILLSQSSLLSIGLFSFGSPAHEHGMVTGMADCPFMAHEETLCPMSVFDHLGVLREAFGAALPSLATLVLALAGAALLPSLEVPRVLPLLRLHAHAFLRWRQLVLYRFVYRPLQALFARGILHPKLF